MPTVGTDTSNQSGQFACASKTQRTLRDLRTKRKGQPLFVVGHILERKGQEAAFEVFNQRLAVIKFPDGVVLGYDPLELLLPTEIDEKGTAFFEIGHCTQCDKFFPLTIEECTAPQDPASCPECGS